MASGFFKKLGDLLVGKGGFSSDEDEGDDGADENPVVGANAEEEALVEWVAQGKFDSVGKFFAGLPYKSRRNFHPLLKKLVAKYRDPWMKPKRRQAALLGLLAASTNSEVKARKGFIDLISQMPSPRQKERDISDATLELIRALKPDWAGHLVEHGLSNQEWINWDLAFELYKDGLCDRPEHVNFALRIPSEIVSGSVDYVRGKQQVTRDPVEFIRQHAEILVPEIERIFTLPETDKGLSRWDLEPEHFHRADFDPETVHFARILERLVEEGVIDRTRLSRRCLGALSITGNKMLAKWYFTLFERLNPSEEAQDGFATEGDVSLLTLLGSANTAVTAWALKRLTALEKAGRGDPDKLVAEIPGAIPGAHKTGAAAALRLLRTLGKKHPELRPAVLEGACEAFLHEDKDLQGRAVGILEEFQQDAGPEFAAALLDHTDTLSPSLRGRFSKLCAGGGELVSAFDEPEEITFRGEPESVLGEDEVIEPIREFGELIEQISHFWQNTEDPVQLERILDGMAACAGERVPEFEERTAPLVQLMKSGAGGGSFQILGLLGSLIKKWTSKGSIGLADLGLGPKADSVVNPGSWPKPFRWYIEEPILSRYISAAGFWLAKKRSHPMLSLPTHRGGWIDPRILVERAVAREKSGDPLVELEGVVSLLRLAHEHRGEALGNADAAGLGGNFGQLLRYALGADLAPGTLPSHPHLQIAAARARYPQGKLPEGIAEVDGPFATHPSRVSFEYEPPQVKEHQWNPKAPPIEVKHSGFVTASVRPESASPAKAPLPPALYHLPKRKWYDMGLDPCLVRWLGTLWPANTEPVLTRGIEVVGHVGRDEKSQDAQLVCCAYIGNLAGKEHGESGYVLTWSALNHVSSATRSAGIDALSVNLECAWFDPAKWAAAFVPMASHGIFLLNRIVPCLAELAQISPAHSHRITGTLCAALGLGEAPPPRLFGKLLEFLVEQRIRHPEIGLSESSRAYLEAIPKKGKIGSLAKKLIGPAI